MEDGEEEDIQSGEHCPIICKEDFPKAFQTGVFRHASLGKIGHQSERKKDFVRGKGKEKSKQDDSVKAHEPGKGIEKAGEMLQQGCSFDLQISENPDEHPGGDCDRHCPAQDENGPVDDRSINHPADFRPSIRRKFQCESGGEAFENRF
jgi:hypothetical protein